jgi:hypothetical protein
LEEAPILEEAAAEEEPEEEEPEEEEPEEAGTDEVDGADEGETSADEPEPFETEDQGEPQDPWTAPAEFPTDALDEADGSDDVPDGFETQILEGAAPASGDSEAEVESEDDPSAIPQEPRWLFSLLKKDQEKGEEA